MVKPIKMVEKVEGKEKLQNISVILEEGSFVEAGANGEWVYDVLNFTDIAGYQVNPTVLGIMKRDGGTLLIPMTRIRQIETSYTEKE